MRAFMSNWQRALAGALLATSFGLSSCGGSGATGIITTFAGTGKFGGTGDGGIATSAELGQVVCVNFDAAGDLYTTDVILSVVRRISQGTNLITTAAGRGLDGFAGDGGPAISAYLYGPTGCVVDNAGNLYFSDIANNQIRKVNASTGIITGFIGNAVPNQTSGGTFSGDGGPAASAGINHTNEIILDKAGNFYFSDTGNSRIRRVDAVSGVVTTVAGTGLYGYSGDGGVATSAEIAQPRGLAFDAAGNLYFADYGDSVVRKIDAGTGIISTVAGVYTPGNIFGFSGDGGPATAAQLGGPVGIAIDAAGDLYIADAGNERIRKVTAAIGIMSTVVGNGNPAYAGDGGLAINASLHNPEGLAIGPDGNSLYIADYFNYVIRKVTPLP